MDYTILRLTERPDRKDQAARWFHANWNVPLDAYLESMTIHGLGGTDFRPVFAHVDALRDQGEFQNLKGLIYFTDGYGTFPARKPDYDAAFVFVDEGVNNYDVPPWAIKLVLRRNEI